MIPVNTILEPGKGNILYLFKCYNGNHNLDDLIQDLTKSNNNDNDNDIDNDNDNDNDNT